MSRKFLTLKQLLGLVKARNPRIKRARAQLKAAEAQLLRARLAWVPKASFRMAYAPVTKVRCQVPQAFQDVTLTGGGTLYDAMNQRSVREQFCLGTDATDTVQDYFSRFDIRNYWFQFDIRLTQPVYTFGKFHYAKKVARAGIAAGQESIVQVWHETAKDVRRAYFGLKLAREILFTIDEGEGHLKKAEKRVAESLDKDDGEVDLTDKFRLRIMRSEVDELKVRTQQAERYALAGIRALVGPGAPEGLDIDQRPLAPVVAVIKPMRHYLNLARVHRPELRLARVAVQAAGATMKLKRAYFFPDLSFDVRVLSHVSASDDDPRNYYQRDMLHGTTFYMGLSLKWNLDFHFKYTDYARARANRVAARHAESQVVAEVGLDVEKAYGSLLAARQRMRVLKKAQRAARSWLTTLSQRHNIGTARTKDLTAALKAYFQTELKRQQAIHDFNMAVVNLSRAVGVDLAKRWEPPRKGKNSK